MTHICVDKLTIIASNNGLSPDRHQAIIWTNAGILLIWPLRTNFSESLSERHIFSFMKMHIFIHENAFETVVCEMSAILFWPQCVKSDNTQIEAWTKWLLFWRQHFQMHFLEITFCIWIQFPLNFVPRSPIGNNWNHQVISWTNVAQFYEAYIHN